MSDIPLSPRLRHIASLVPVGARLVDVGCDHALLPLYVLSRNPTATAVGIDNKASPLAVAEANRVRYGMENRLTLLHASGIPEQFLETGDCTVIAGIGGMEIRAILAATAPRLGRFLLSPHSRAERLRAQLPPLGLSIRSETTVEDEGRSYVVIEAVPAAGLKPYSKTEQWIGPCLLKRLDAAYMDPALDLFFLRLERHLTNVVRRDKTAAAALHLLRNRKKG